MSPDHGSAPMQTSPSQRRFQSAADEAQPATTRAGSSAMPRTLSVALLALAVALGALLCTMILPGIVAAYGGVFHLQGVKGKLPAKAARTLAEYENREKRRQQQIENIDRLFAQPQAANLKPELANSLLQFRNQLKKEAAEASPPVVPVPFFPQPQIFLFPALYTSLGWLLLLARPTAHLGRQRGGVLATLLAAVAIYVFYDWPLWVRNLVPLDEARRIYAYANLDIHALSFATQELMIVGFAVLLATVWWQWSRFFLHRKKELEDNRDAMAIALDTTTWERLSATFTQWQVCSVLLAIGFLFATSFYWKIEARFHDPRYQMSAISIHLLWGVTWVLLSSPLMITWREWERVRTQALSSLLSEPGVTAEKIGAVNNLLTSMQPLSPATVLVSAGGALGSFVLPLLQLLIK